MIANNVPSVVFRRMNNEHGFDRLITFIFHTLVRVVAVARTLYAKTNYYHFPEFYYFHVAMVANMVYTTWVELLKE